MTTSTHMRTGPTRTVERSAFRLGSLITAVRLQLASARALREAQRGFEQVPAAVGRHSVAALSAGPEPLTSVDNLLARVESERIRWDGTVGSSALQIAASDGLVLAARTRSVRATGDRGRSAPHPTSSAPQERRAREGEDGGPGDGEDKDRPARGQPMAVSGSTALTVLVVFALVVVLFGITVQMRSSLAAKQAQRQAGPTALVAANDAVGSLFSINMASSAQAVARILSDNTSSSFAADYAKGTTSWQKKLIGGTASLSGSVIAAGLVSVGGGHAQALVAAAATRDGVRNDYRMLVTMQKTFSFDSGARTRWVVSGIVFLP